LAWVCQAAVGRVGAVEAAPFKNPNFALGARFGA